MATGKRSNAVVTFEQSGSELRFTAGGQTTVLDMAKVKMQAFAEKRGIEFAAAVKVWAGADKIVEEVARMKAAIPAKAKADADSLLDELDA